MAVRSVEQKPKNQRSRMALGGLLLIVVLSGLASRTFAEALPNFIAANAGDALWTVAVFLVLALVWPRSPPLALGLAAFAVSAVVEFSQLIDLAWLTRLRTTTVGGLFLGSGFVWIDLVRYFAGAATATVIDWVTTASRHTVKALR